MEWLGGVFYRGFKAAVEQVQDLTRGLDLRDEAQRMAVLPEVRGILSSSFTNSQQFKNEDCYKGYVLAAMGDAGNDLERANQMASSLSGVITATNKGSLELMSGLEAQFALADPANTFNNQKLGKLAAALGISRLVLDHLKDGPSLIEQCPSIQDIGRYGDAVTKSAALREALAAAVAPEKRAATARSAASGQLVEELSVKHYEAKPALDPKTGAELRMQQDWKKLIRQGEGFVVGKAKVDYGAIMDVSVEFNLGRALGGPGRQQQAPQMKKQPPQKTTPQMGGMVR